MKPSAAATGTGDWCNFQKATCCGHIWSWASAKAYDVLPPAKIHAPFVVVRLLLDRGGGSELSTGLSKMVGPNALQSALALHSFGMLVGKAGVSLQWPCPVSPAG